MSVVMRIGDAWRQVSRRIDRLDARLLLEHVSGCTHADLVARPEMEMSEEHSMCLESLVRRRETGEPLAYLVGNAWFCGLEFKVNPAVLIPRQDTEVLVNVAVEKAKALEKPAIVDLGTGTGIVAVLISRMCPQARLTAVDMSAAALDVAQANGRRYGGSIRFLEGDWYAPLGDERFDIIVSNPPYVVAGDPHLQQNGLPFEPQQALTDGVAGGDGLACIRRIVDGASGHLRSGGWLLMEHGYDQAVEVRRRLMEAGFGNVTSWPDGAGIERVSGGRFDA